MLAGLVCIATSYSLASKKDARTKEWVGGRETYTEGGKKIGRRGGQQQRNQNMEIVKLVGLIFFCVGGLTLAAALMIPSFLYRYFEIDGIDNKDLTPSKETTSLIDASEKPSTSTSSTPANQRLADESPSAQSSQERSNTAFQ